jgi:hypothetical protein
VGPAEKAGARSEAGAHERMRAGRHGVGLYTGLGVVHVRQPMGVAQWCVSSCSYLGIAVIDSDVYPP